MKHSQFKKKKIFYGLTLDYDVAAVFTCKQHFKDGNDVVG